MQLTRDLRARDVIPVWSPDGTRIAFGRGYADGRDEERCVTTVDGNEVRCQIGNAFGRFTVGWANATEVIAAAPDTTGTHRIVVIDVETSNHRTVADGRVLGRSRAPGWIACFCRRKPTEPYQTLVIPVNDPDRAIRLLGVEPPPDVWLFDVANDRHYLDSVRIVGPQHPIAVDAFYRLALHGWDANGTPLEPLAVRWWSGDTLIATVDSLGEVRPRREGPVMIHATAGGWRGDSMELQIGPPGTRLVFRDDWRDGLDARWTQFGEPRPLVQLSDRGPTLVPNGDSTFSSGIYLRESLPVRQGMGLDFDVSTPIAQVVWQNIHFLVMSPQPSDRTSWDHAKGFLPISQMTWRACRLDYPAEENVRGAESIQFSGGLAAMVAVPPDMRNGAWVRLRIQVFPDGRCGLAVNGIPRVILNTPITLGDSATIMIWSVEHNTTFRVGPIEVWRGVRSDIDWQTVEHR